MRGNKILERLTVKDSNTPHSCDYRYIKGSFTMTLQGIDPNKTKLRNLEGELYQLENQVLLFEESAKEKKAREKKINKLNNGNRSGGENLII